MVSNEPVLLMVAAEAPELAPLARALGATQQLPLPVRWSRAGALGAAAVLLAANGPGRENATRAVREICERYPVRGIVSAGWCGALDPALRAGEVIVADRVISLAPAADFRTQAPDHASSVRSGALITVDHFVGSAEEKRRLRDTGAIAVDMEAAGVAAEAARRRLPLFSIRAVSDTAERTFHLDFNQARRGDGSFSPLKVAVLAGLRPTRWSELLGFWRQALGASAQLARFVGGCRFEG